MWYVALSHTTEKLVLAENAFAWTVPFVVPLVGREFVDDDVVDNVGRYHHGPPVEPSVPVVEQLPISFRELFAVAGVDVEGVVLEGEPSVGVDAG